MKKKAFVNRRRFRYGTLSTALLLLSIGILIAVNVAATALEKKNGWRVDLSFNGITTQSAATREALADLPYPVHIYALFYKGQEDAQLTELLNRYAAASPMVTWELEDPALNPALIARFSSDTEAVSSDSLIVSCESTGRYRILSPESYVSLSMDTETGQYTWAGYTYERALTGAILHVTRDSIPRIVILQGHGELDGDTLSAFDSLMTDHYYETVYADLSAADYEPDPKDLLVFFSPMRDINETELKKLLAFSDQGGSMLFTCDYSDPVQDMPNYSALLRLWGFLPREGIVVADTGDPDSFYSNIRIDLIPKMLSTEVTMDMIASGADTVLLPGSRAFEDPGETDRNLMVQPVLRSGDTAWLKRITAETASIEREEGDPAGPFVLALQAQRITEAGQVSRAFISGSSGMLTEDQIYAMTDTRQFVIRMVQYLMNTSSDTPEIPARNAVRPGLSARSARVGSVLVTALPMLALLAALGVLLPRRKR